MGRLSSPGGLEIARSLFVMCQICSKGNACNCELTILVVLKGITECAHDCQPEGPGVFVTALGALKHLNSVLNNVTRISSDNRLADKLVLNSV